MTDEPAYFVGGCKDGTAHLVDHRAMSVDFPAIPKQPVRDWEDWEPSVSFKLHTYRRERFVCDNTVWNLFIYSELSMEQAIQMILDRYVEPKGQP